MRKLIAALVLVLPLTGCSSAPSCGKPGEEVLISLTPQGLRMLMLLLDPHRNPVPYKDQREGKGVA